MGTRVDTQKAYTGKFKDSIGDIVSQYAYLLTGHSTDPSSADDDMNCISDLRIHVHDIDVLSRMRDASKMGRIQYRDFTVRSKVVSGRDTELHKLLRGNGHWYFYGWSFTVPEIYEWMIIDLDILRTTTLLSNAKEIGNYDGETKFISIPRGRLESVHAIVVQRKIIDGHADVIIKDSSSPVKQSTKKVSDAQQLTMDLW